MEINDIPFATILVSILMIAGYAWLPRSEGISPENLFPGILLFHFIHSGIAHLVENMASLWIAAPVVERRGRIRMLGILFLTSSIGGLSAVMLLGIHGIGISAGIFGLFGWLMVDGKEWFGQFPASFISFAYSIFNLAQALSGPAGISYTAHAIGFIAGMLMAWPPEKFQKNICISAIAINVLAAIVELVR